MLQEHITYLGFETNDEKKTFYNKKIKLIKNNKFNSKK